MFIQAPLDKELQSFVIDEHSLIAEKVQLDKNVVAFLKGPTSLKIFSKVLRVAA